MNRRRFLWAALLLAAWVPATAQEHVIVISVDGLRPDAIDAAGAKTLQGLIQEGTWCPKARTVRPSVTLPSHTAMLTGLTVEHHGVTWNGYREGRTRLLTFLKIVKGRQGSTAMFFAKTKFQYLADPACVDHIVGPHPKKGGPRNADELATAFVEAWAKTPFTAAFIHFREPDSEGHSKGWMGEKYLDGVRRADAAIGRIVETLKGDGSWEATALIVSADHGGSGKSHSKDLPENNTIPWICVGPGVPKGKVIDREVRTYDTAPTALAFLKMGIPGKIDGTIVEEVFPK